MSKTVKQVIRELRRWESKMYAWATDTAGTLTKMRNGRDIWIFDWEIIRGLCYKNFNRFVSMLFQEVSGVQSNAGVSKSFGEWDNAEKDHCPNASIPFTTDYLSGLKNDPILYFIFFSFCNDYTNLFCFISLIISSPSNTCWISTVYKLSS